MVNGSLERDRKPILQNEICSWNICQFRGNIQTHAPPSRAGLPSAHLLADLWRLLHLCLSLHLCLCYDTDSSYLGSIRISSDNTCQTLRMIA